MDHFTEETEKAGFPGLHVQVIGFGGNELPGILQYDLMQGKTNSEVVDYLSINSVIKYNWEPGRGTEHSDLLKLLPGEGHLSLVVPHRA
jgi:hypothetical protein